MVTSNDSINRKMRRKIEDKKMGTKEMGMATMTMTKSHRDSSNEENNATSIPPFDRLSSTVMLLLLLVVMTRFSSIIIIILVANNNNNNNNNRDSSRTSPEEGDGSRGRCCRERWYTGHFFRPTSIKAELAGDPKIVAVKAAIRELLAASLEQHSNPDGGMNEWMNDLMNHAPHRPLLYHHITTRVYVSVKNLKNDSTLSPVVIQSSWSLFRRIVCLLNLFFYLLLRGWCRFRRRHCRLSRGVRRCCCPLLCLSLAASGRQQWVAEVFKALFIEI